MLDSIVLNLFQNYSDGKIVVDEDKLMDVWRAHYDGISNEEFAWDREGLTNVSPVCGPSEKISAGRSTTDAIFTVRQLQEKYLARNKELWMAFVDLEKAFDRVPMEVVWWALRYLV